METVADAVYARNRCPTMALPDVKSEEEATITIKYYAIAIL